MSIFDHSCAVEDVLAAGIDVWASEGTLKAIEESLHLHRRCHIIEDRNSCIIASNWDVFSFSIHHDAAEPLGFIIRDRSSNESLLFATDTSHLTQRFGETFTIVALSCNYDKDIVQKRLDVGDIDESVAKRLLSSHMDWHNTKRYLQEFCNLTRCREIHLLHPSAGNLDKEAVRKDIEESLFIKTFI